MLFFTVEMHVTNSPVVVLEATNDDSPDSDSDSDTNNHIEMDM